MCVIAPRRAAHLIETIARLSSGGQSVLTGGTYRRVWRCQGGRCDGGTAGVNHRVSSGVAPCAEIGEGEDEVVELRSGFGDLAQGAWWFW